MVIAISETSNSWLTSMRSNVTAGKRSTCSSSRPSACTRPSTKARVRSVGIPVHTGYFIPDLRTVELGWWDERGCHAAFIQLMGQEGVSENRVTEIPPATTLPALKVGFDEAVYVLGGRGLTTVWSPD